MERWRTTEDTVTNIDKRERPLTHRQGCRHNGHWYPEFKCPYFVPRTSAMLRLRLSVRNAGNGRYVKKDQRVLYTDGLTNEV